MPRVQAQRDGAMALAACERLSAQDRMFLALEGPDAHMHIAATLVFKPGPLATRSGGVDFKTITDYIASRLDAIPRYRQRVVRAPVTGDLFWADDDRFNLTFHVRAAGLPRPGDVESLQRLSGRIMSQQLDRGKPLWETYVVDGLKDGRFALVNKTHHCMADGIAGTELLAALLSPDSKAKIPPRARWSPTAAPGSAELLIASLRHAIAAPARLARLLARGSVREGSGTAWSRYFGPVRETLRAGLQRAPDSPLNVPIGPHRRFGWLALDLKDVKAVKDRLGGTVNDVVLATVAGALRRFFKRRDPAIKLVDLRALVPVNVRTPSDQGSLGNRVSAWLVPLPVQDWDPRRRLAKVSAVSAELKASNRATGAEMLSGAGAALLSLGTRLARQIRPFNLVVTNVPGPTSPLFLLGAPLEEVYPQVPLFPNQGLGIALFSYNGKLFWGFNADCHVVPDLDGFRDAVADSFAELLGATHPLRAVRFAAQSDRARDRPAHTPPAFRVVEKRGGGAREPRQLDKGRSRL